MTVFTNIRRFLRRHSGVDANEPRASIWSIPESRRTLYFGLFAVLTLVGVGWICWYEIFYKTGDDWPETVNSIFRNIPTAGTASAVATVSTIETWRFIVVVGDWLAMKIQESRRRKEEEEEARIAEAVANAVAEAREQVRAEVREQTIAEAREQVRAEVREQNAVRMEVIQQWNQRREAAIAAGEEFAEPLPSFQDDATQ